MMISTEWTLAQLMRLHGQQPEIVEAALNRLLAEDKALAWSLVINAYLEQKINLGKAAELLDLHPLALRERFIELGIPLRSGPADMDEARAEVSGLEEWFNGNGSDQ